MKKYVFTAGLVLLITCCCSLSVPGQECRFENSAAGVSFSTPVEFSQPVKAGLDVYSLTYPATAKTGSELVEIILVSISLEMQENMAMSEKELLDYVKVTFLGASAKARSTKERTFMGQSIKGDVQETTIPRRARLEAYLVPLSGEAKCVIAFRCYDEMPEKEAEKIISSVALTLKEGK